MDKRKAVIFLSFIFLIAVAFIFINYAQVDLNTKNVLEDIQIHEDVRLIFYDTGEYIESQLLKKQLLGWKSIGLTAPIKKAKGNEPYVPDVQGLRVGDFMYYFGYVNPDFVNSVMLETKEFNFEYKVNAFFWYIISKENVTNQNLSFLMRDGTKVYYPFQ